MALQFDYAEATRLPIWAGQPGDSYFHTGPWLGLFGAVVATNRHPIIYMLQEGRSLKDPSNKCCLDKGGRHTAAHGAVNATISLVHDFLNRCHEQYPSASSLKLFADNCVNQNKSRWIINFLHWYITVNDWVEEIELAFGVPGHTKFSPDGYFGTVKARLNRSEHWGFRDTRAQVESATAKLEAVLGNVTYHDWKAHLDQFYSPGKVCNCPASIIYLKISNPPRRRPHKGRAQPAPV